MVDGVVKQTTSMPLVIDYSKSIAKLVEAGHYDNVPAEIAEHFPRESGDAEVTAVLVSFDREFTTEELIAELDRLGLRPATMTELLAFGAMYPEIGYDDAVIAVGSFWTDEDGDDCFGCIVGDLEDEERGLTLTTPEGGSWESEELFLAIAK